MTKQNHLTSSRAGTFYLAYGSNLSVHQMRLRLPNNKTSSDPVAVALLRNYKWIICERGYANVIPDQNPKSSSMVYGILYNLSPADEAALDLYEGHNQARNPKPQANPSNDANERLIRPFLQGGWDYNKLYLDLEIVRWIQDPSSFGVLDSRRQGGDVAMMTRALIYVDEFRLSPGIIATEYIGRMNRGIREAVDLGMPASWVESVMRPFIPRDIWVDDEGYVGDQRGYVEEAAATETIEPDEIVNVQEIGLDLDLERKITEKDIVEVRREQGIID